MMDPNRLYRLGTRASIAGKELNDYTWAQNATMADKYAAVYGASDPRITVLRQAIARRNTAVACAMLKELGRPNMTGYRSRGTMTIDAKGRTGNFGTWDPSLDESKSQHVQKIGRELDTALGIALKYHSQNRAIVEKKPIAMAEPQVRAAQARADLRALEKAKQQLASVKKEAMVLRQSLTPYNYALTATNASTRDTFQARAELRSVMRGMDPKTRMQALGESAELRAAMLELPAQASGMTEADYNLIHQAELETKFPTELQHTAEADRAYQAALQTIRTVEQAIGNELKAVDTPAAELTPAPAPTSFD